MLCTRDVFPIQEGEGPKIFQKLAGMLFLTYFQEQAARFPRIFVLNMSWSKVRLMKEFEQWIDWMLYERRMLGLKQNPTEKRLRPREYLKYLEVYDLRKKRWTFNQIGEYLWKNSWGDVEIDKKAREFYKRGENFVMTPPLMPSR